MDFLQARSNPQRREFVVSSNTISTRKNSTGKKLLLSTICSSSCLFVDSRKFALLRILVMNRLQCDTPLYFCSSEMIIWFLLKVETSFSKCCHEAGNCSLSSERVKLLRCSTSTEIVHWRTETPLLHAYEKSRKPMRHSGRWFSQSTNKAHHWSDSRRYRDKSFRNKLKVDGCAHPVLKSIIIRIAVTHWHLIFRAVSSIKPSIPLSRMIDTAERHDGDVRLQWSSVAMQKFVRWRLLLMNGLFSTHVDLLFH
jgi:hypothetical protein